MAERLHKMLEVLTQQGVSDTTNDDIYLAGGHNKKRRIYGLENIAKIVPHEFHSRPSSARNGRTNMPDPRDQEIAELKVRMVRLEDVVNISITDQISEIGPAQERQITSKR